MDQERASPLVTRRRRSRGCGGRRESACVCVFEEVSRELISWGLEAWATAPWAVRSDRRAAEGPPRGAVIGSVSRHTSPLYVARFASHCHPACALFYWFWLPLPLHKNQSIIYSNTINLNIYLFKFIMLECVISHLRFVSLDWGSICVPSVRVSLELPGVTQSWCPTTHH